MKKRQISTFIIALLTLSNILMPQRLHAQEEKAAMPFYQGTMVGVDVAGLLGKAFGSAYASSEALVMVNLQNRFFPTLEVGYGTIDTTDDETDSYYKAAAPYVRIGADYNVFHKKPHLPGYLTVGLRYGLTSFDYDVKAPDLVDPNWGGTAVPVDYTGVKTTAQWAELVIGLKANVFKGLYAGFTVRTRARLGMTAHENSEPYYIPGYGKGSKTNIGITYNLIYKLPF